MNLPTEEDRSYVNHIRNKRQYINRDRNAPLFHPSGPTQASENQQKKSVEARSKGVSYLQGGVRSNGPELQTKDGDMKARQGQTSPL